MFVVWDTMALGRSGGFLWWISFYPDIHDSDHM